MTLIDSKPAEDGFARTLAARDATAAKLDALKPKRERLVAARDTAAAAAVAAKGALSNIALRRADGEDVSAAKATRLVADTEAEAQAHDEAVAILDADIATANVEFLKAEAAHGVHAEAKLQLVVVDKVRNLAKVGRAFGSAVVDVTESVNDLAELQQNNRAELFKLNPALAVNAPRYVCDENLQRPDRLCGALGGHLLDRIVTFRPSGIDLDEIASREEVEAKRAVR